jgi:ubiquinone/menaquinone biosynthesis C-methylase UbiE
MSEESQPGGGSVCPARHAGFLATSLRRLVHNPEKILAGLIDEGQTVADLGCGPGFFTIPMAGLVGESGRVIAIDLQQAMLDKMMRAAQRQGVASCIEPHKCETDSIGVGEQVDFALAFYMVHEVPDVERFLGQVAAMLRPQGRFLLVEPKLHVSAAAFARTVEIARGVELIPVLEPRIAFSRSALLRHERRRRAITSG